MAAQAQDFTIQARANSNENDEDYDGLVVFKKYVEVASKGAIAVALFSTRNCAAPARNACRARPTAPLTSMFPPRAVLRAFPLCSDS
jgi:hypothetical protein